jgi:spermidine synthase
MLPIIQNYLPTTMVLWVIFAIYLVVFFVTAMVCHGELVKLRPKVAYLTEYYWWIAAGGLLGSIFNVLIAPLIFTNFIEYPLILALACMLRPKTQPQSMTIYDFFWLIIIALGLLAITRFDNSLGYSIFYSLLLIIVFSTVERPIRFGFGVALLLLMVKMTPLNEQTIFQTRNFFGSLRVADTSTVRILQHGNIIHGVQNLDDSTKLQILSYYTPLRNVFMEFDQQYSTLNIAIAGLGTGTIACYGRKQDKITFYEIDRKVVDVANKYFSFLQLCAPHAKIILGDARLSLKQAPPASYQVIILDTFSSDAIPAHMITKEAIQLYLQKLASGGVLLIHISNRYLDLSPMLAAISQQLKLISLFYSDNNNGEYIFPSTWVAMSQNNEDGSNLKRIGWQPLVSNGKTQAWRDDFSNIISVLK